MAQIVRPIADNTLLGSINWTTPAWSTVDEVIASDVDFTELSVVTSGGGGDSSLVMDIGSVTKPSTDACTIRFRAAFNCSLTDLQTINIYLFDLVKLNSFGNSIPLTLGVDLPNDGAFHDYTIVFDANAVSLWSNPTFEPTWGSLSVGVVWSGAQGGPSTDQLKISWLEVEFPDMAQDCYKLTLPTYTAIQCVPGGSAKPSDFSLPYDQFVDGVFYPKGTTFSWVLDAAPDDNGWFLSVGEQFAGAGQTLDNTLPRNPRSFTEIGAFATGATGMMGGFPGPSCVFDNHLVYAKGGYTVGTDNPPIQVFDGQFDHELVRLPNTAAGVVPKAVMSMLSANGTIYLSTLDSGTNSTNWSGRVFSLDLVTAKLTPIGAAFPAGHVPYALAWHMGRLWVGTHRQSTASTGKIYFFRPDIDTSWTEDHDLTADSLGSVTSLLSYKGLLYVGTTGAAATFSKVLVRSELGVYTGSLTGSGGAAAANNGFLALAEFQSNLYAAFWNPDTTAVSKIYKFDNSTWSTAYTGATTTLVPFLGFPTDNNILLAIGGGLSYNATLLSTANGTSWSDRTAFLTQSSPACTGLPVFGVVVH